MLFECIGHILSQTPLPCQAIINSPFRPFSPESPPPKPRLHPGWLPTGIAGAGAEDLLQGRPREKSTILLFQFASGLEGMSRHGYSSARCCIVIAAKDATHHSGPCYTNNCCLQDELGVDVGYGKSAAKLSWRTHQPSPCRLLYAVPHMHVEDTFGSKKAVCASLYMLLCYVQMLNILVSPCPCICRCTYIHTYRTEDKYTYPHSLHTPNPHTFGLRFLLFPWPPYCRNLTKKLWAYNPNIVGSIK